MPNFLRTQNSLKILFFTAKSSIFFSFRVVAAHWQESLFINFDRNIKIQRDYDNYPRHNKNLLQRNLKLWKWREQCKSNVINLFFWTHNMKVLWVCPFVVLSVHRLVWSFSLELLIGIFWFFARSSFVI